MKNELASPSAKHPLDNKIPPPFVTVLIGALMWAATFIEPAVHLRSSPRALGACLVIALGVTLLASGFLAFRRARTTIDPVQIDRASSLVTRGIFRFTRNPMYVGFATLLIGWAVFLAAPWAFLGPILFVLFTTRFQILPEERVMQSKFGDAYAEYRRNVRRWI